MMTSNIRQVLGLSYLHGLGIVHHDFKPENVVIDPQGHCIITDFGGSRFLNERGKLTRTAQEDIICSCPYAAPELFEERSGVMFYDERVDWFSLGVVIYTLLVGSVCPSVTHNLFKEPHWIGFRNCSAETAKWRRDNGQRSKLSFIGNSLTKLKKNLPFTISCSR